MPFRSVAAALLLAIVFGPIGLFYASLVGGLVMTAFGLVAVGTIMKMGSLLPIATLWLVSIVWAMIAVRYYNYQLLKRLERQP